jgi:hypothetical protein
MTNYETQAAHQPTPQETALIAAHVSRAAELRQQMDLLLLRSMVQEAEEQQA